jgi:RAT1-interacting protein
MLKRKACDADGHVVVDELEQKELIVSTAALSRAHKRVRLDAPFRATSPISVSASALTSSPSTSTSSAAAAAPAAAAATLKPRLVSEFSVPNIQDLMHSSSQSHKPQWLNNKPVSMSQPSRVTAYQIIKDEKGNRSHQLNGVFRPPIYTGSRIGQDLSHGYTSSCQSSEDATSDQSSVVDIIHALKHAKFDWKNSRARIITFRNNLNKIMATLYQPKSAWSIRITRLPLADDLLALHVVHLPGSQCEPGSWGHKCAHFGRRFEHTSMKFTQRHTADGAPASVAQLEQCVVNRTKIGSHRIVMACELDCIDSKGQLTELKTHRYMLHAGHERSFRQFKLLKTWIQSYLGGVGKVIFGFQDRGILKSTQQYDTLRIASLCRNEWNGNLCIQFTNAVLDWAVTHIEQQLLSNPDAEFTLSYMPKHQRIELYSSSSSQSAV